jgi:hypothetical protein
MSLFDDSPNLGGYYAFNFTSASWGTDSYRDPDRAF